MVTFDVGEVAVGFAILSTSLLLRAKLNAFSAREARKDFENIVCSYSTISISLVADIAGLDSDTRQDFVESDSFLQLNEGSAARVYGDASSLQTQTHHSIKSSLVCKTSDPEIPSDETVCRRSLVDT